MIIYPKPIIATFMFDTWLYLFYNHIDSNYCIIVTYDIVLKPFGKKCKYFLVTTGSNSIKCYYMH
jgi:hypothetical protein